MLEKGFEQYIREVKLNKDDSSQVKDYPFSIKAIKVLDTLEMHPNVTFIVGENGSGKSTLLEAISVAYGFNPEGGTKNFNFSTESTHSELYKHLKIVKGVKIPRDGFFLRAESFYNVATNIDELERLDGGLLQSYGGISLHKQSHGESFMALLLNRFRGNGLYILDEPEAALSPIRQMAMISRIHELVKEKSQFIIATHSPIIMAYPHSKIYSIDDNYKEIYYKDTEHYNVMKNFINNTDKMLDILMG